VRDLLPDNIDLQAKQGFSIPSDNWLRGSLKNVLENTLSSASVIKRGFFKLHKVTQLKNAFLQKQAHWSIVWLLIVIEL